jgi:hypothetical protein
MTKLSVSFTDKQLLRHTRAVVRLMDRRCGGDWCLRRRLSSVVPVKGGGAATRVVPLPLWERLRRHARVVGIAALALRGVYRDVVEERYRPGGVFEREAAARFNKKK